MPRLSKIGAAALAAFGWTSGAAGVTASYLVVAGGGGGGGQYYSGGGGAGGYQSGTTPLALATSYTVTVGAGGAGGVGVSVRGVNGSNSSFGTLTASVGGGGGGAWSGNPNGLSGGSGGGGGGSYSGSGGAGTASQGNAGGTASSAGGGGGGAGAVGANASSTNGGNGGVGIASSISGTSTYYAGGGGGGPANVGGPDGTPGTGGLGGGGNGGTGNSPSGLPGYAGTANTGGGGGGDMASNSGGGQGGSGIVIISYTGAQQFGGGVVTSVGGNTIHTFTTSGVLSPISSLSASYLIVAGGGAGGGEGNDGGAGGGGAGGLLSGSGLTIDTNSTYLVTVGAGGTVTSSATVYSTSGSNSTFSAVSTAAVGGGYGANRGDVYHTGGNGGSGGGGGPGGSSSSGNGTGGTGTSGQGYAGGLPYYNNGADRKGGGGGGGAGAVGGDGNSSALTPGNGGVGLTSSISGSSVYYSGGGGGGGDSNGNYGTGGNGGGGVGASNNTSAGAGTANSGGGGGGGANAVGYTGAAGGSGIVIISYAGSTQQMAGGSVTITGGNVIHTFTSSGYLTPLKLVGNSLRFRKSAGGYLLRTPTVASSQQIFTFSAWVKRGSLGVTAYLAGNISYGSSGALNEQFNLFFETDNTFKVYNYANSAPGYLLTTSQVFRDPAAWYHIVVAFDTTQATAANRVKLYVNGTQVTSFSTANYPSQNYNTYWNRVLPAGIGAIAGTVNGATWVDTASYYDGEMTEFNFIDGQQLTPNSFGTFNSYGVWQPINYGGSYGTNGFYLPFSSGTSTYAGYFNGTNQKLNTVSGPTNYSTGDFTFECWINPNTVGTYLPLMATNTTNGAWIGKNGTNFVLRAFSVADLLSTPNQPVAGVWTHIAVTRSGSTAYIFYNGVLQVSGTVTQNFLSGQTWLGTDTGSLYYGGYMSNVRSIIGTALYTSNFTPPTANLTAVSGTQLLTLQNSTIIDNSTNAYTITNTNGVTTGQTYPFSAAKIFNDASPQGNNWTPNNISGASGSTLDYMTDVPTLTSATVANYAVFNPLNIDPAASGVPTLTNGNLTATGGNQVLGFSTMGITTGKIYWEYTILNVPSTPTMHLGVTVSPFSGTYLRAYRYDTGDYFNGTAWVAYGATFTTNDVIGVALDMTSQTIEFFKNNTSQGQKTSIGLTGQTMFPYIYINSSPGSVAINFGQQPFVYTPQSGFVALNTYNI